MRISETDLNLHVFRSVYFVVKMPPNAFSSVMLETGFINFRFSDDTERAAAEIRIFELIVAKCFFVVHRIKSHSARNLFICVL